MKNLRNTKKAQKFSVLQRKKEDVSCSMPQWYYGGAFSDLKLHPLSRMMYAVRMDRTKKCVHCDPFLIVYLREKKNEIVRIRAKGPCQHSQQNPIETNKKENYNKMQ